MPRAVFADQDLTLSVISRESSGCGCTPRQGGSGLSVDLEVCDCCEACMCIDSGYEASDTRPAPPPGEHLVPVTGLMAQTLYVHERDQCRVVADAPSLRIERPTDFLQGGPALTWAVVSDDVYECCVEPRYVVESRRSGNTFELTAYDCRPPVDCACASTEPTRFESWHALGELAPGSYEATIAGLELPFAIP
jgi:hypothetical protein